MGGPLKTGLYFIFSGLTTAAVGPWAGALITRIGATPIILACAVATLVSSAVFLDIGVSSNSEVIAASRLLAGLGFGLAYPALNIQALSRVRDDEQGLASGLVGSSFQIGGAIVLATTTATLLAHTPANAFGRPDNARLPDRGLRNSPNGSPVRTACVRRPAEYVAERVSWPRRDRGAQADTIETEQPLEQAA